VAIENNGSRGWLSFTLLIIELNLIVWVGYYTERNAGNAIKELEELAAPQAMVCRDGRWQELPVRELVPGDLVALKGGDVIPADCELVGDGEPLKVDESSLTGESLEVTRRPGDRVLAGAVVASGELDAVVASTGKDTFFGKTMALLAQPQERGHLNIVLGALSSCGSSGCCAST
jgi:H+-transporting ATPase